MAPSVILSQAAGGKFIGRQDDNLRPDRPDPALDFLGKTSFSRRFKLGAKLLFLIFAAHPQLPHFAV
jgi:hypothetical protein